MVLIAELPMKFDIIQYRASDTLTECRIIYSFPDTALRYVPRIDGYAGAMYLAVEWSDTSRVNRSGMEWIADNISATPVVLHEKNMLGIKTLYLKPGTYVFTFTARDMADSNRKMQNTVPVQIRKFPSRGVSLSDIQTASLLELPQDDAPSAWGAQFRRNGILLVPDPASECIGNNPELKLYTEVYGFMPGDTLDIKYTILDAAKREVTSIPVIKPVLAQAQTEIINLPLDIIPSGVYMVKLSAYSRKKSKDSCSVMRRFYVINPEMPPELATTFSEEELFQQSEFATYSEARIEEEYEKAKCMATKSETSLFESLTALNARQKFMYRFWKERDPSPETAINERLETFRKSITYANTYFSSPQFKEGWKSDRGRVLRKYGFPTQVDRKNMSNRERPYETWFYAEIQGGVYFYFVDIKDINNHILVSSTAVGEVRNDNWYQQFANIDSGNGQNPANGFIR